MEAVTGPSTVSPVHLRSICSLATVWIQFGYSLAILWLHSGYSLATVRLHSSYLLATVWLHAGYSLAILWLHSGYSSATVRLRAGYILAIVRLHFSYILATVWLHAGYSLGTLWLHSGYSLATALQPRSGCWRRRRGSVGRCPAAIRCQLGHGVRAAVLISSPDNQQRCSFDISPSGEAGRIPATLAQSRRRCTAERGRDSKLKLKLVHRCLQLGRTVSAFCLSQLRWDYKRKRLFDLAFSNHRK